MNPISAHPLAPNAAAMAYGPNGPRSAFRWAAWILATLLALLLGLLALLLIGIGTGPVGLLTGIVVAVLPVPVYVTLVLWIDRYESEPLWMLATAFFWGALVAACFSLIVNSLGAALVTEAFDEDAATFFGLVISAPLVEETAKAFALFVLFFWKRDEFDGVIDGIVYAAMVGLGFAMTENVKYYGEAFVEGNAAGVFIVRGLFSPFSHPLFTSMTGMGLGLARQSRNRAVKVAAPLAGLALAILLHSSWNATAYFGEKLESGVVIVLTYILVMIPIFAGLLAAVALALRHEGQILRTHLWCDLERGDISREEYARLCSLRSRFSASFEALTKGGVAHWRARRQLHDAASELAFHRSRVSRGITAGHLEDAAREAAYIQLICELGARLGSSQAVQGGIRPRPGSRI
jgi:RsiW-degrading membrane proteinase PrsW (M82 family)